MAGNYLISVRRVCRESVYKMARRLRVEELSEWTTEESDRVSSQFNSVIKITDYIPPGFNHQFSISKPKFDHVVLVRSVSLLVRSILQEKLHSSQLIEDHINFKSKCEIV